MNNKKVLLGVGMFALVAIVAIPAISHAYFRDNMNKGPNYTPERHLVMMKAFENNDYEAWKKEMNGRGRITSIINKDNFAKFNEMHRLNLEGKTVEAQKIRNELGLGGQGFGKNGGCNGSGRQIYR